VKTEATLVANIDKLHLIAAALIQKETLDGGELEELMATGTIADKVAITADTVVTKSDTPPTDSDKQAAPKVVYISRS